MGQQTSLFLLILVGAAEKDEGKKMMAFPWQKNNIPKVITASIIDSFRCRAVVRWLSGLKQRL